MFDGETYDHDADFERLDSQLERVRYLLTHPVGQWWTLSDLKEQAGGSEAAVSARIRDLRKPKFGALDIQSERFGHKKAGLWHYRVRPKLVA